MAARTWGRYGLMVLAMLVLMPAAQAITALSDSDMENVSGSGIAIVLENMQIAMGPQSYIRSVGSTPESGTTLQQGDLYWFGFTLSGDQAVGQQWAASSSSSATAHTCDTTSAVSGKLACSVGSGAATQALAGGTGTPGLITNLAAFDNPYVLRAYTYQAPDVNNNPSASNTVLELLGPTCVGPSVGGVPTVGCSSTPEDPFRWSFWGAIQVTAGSGATASTSGTLKDQVIIEGVPASYLYPEMVGCLSTSTPTSCANSSSARPEMYQGTVNQIFHTIADTSVAGDVGTFGMVSALTLSGNFRFGVGQTGTDADSASIGTVPFFDNTEGLYFRNVQSYLPFGRLNYQAVTFNSDGAGNLVLELTALPNESADYTDLYGLEPSELTSFSCTSGSSQCGYQTAHDAQCNTVGGVQCNTGSSGNWTSVPVSYYQTHGYVQWGLGTPSTYNLPGCSAYSGSSPWACTSASNSLGGSRPYMALYGQTSPCVAATCYTSTTDGIYFSAGSFTSPQTFNASASNTDPSCISTGICAGYKTSTNTTCSCNTYYTDSNINTVNLGTANIQGLLIQHLKFTTLGAN